MVPAAKAAVLGLLLLQGAPQLVKVFSIPVAKFDIAVSSAVIDVATLALAVSTPFKPTIRLSSTKRIRISIMYNL